MFTERVIQYFHPAFWLHAPVFLQDINVQGLVITMRVARPFVSSRYLKTFNIPGIDIHIYMTVEYPLR